MEQKTAPETEESERTKAQDAGVKRMIEGLPQAARASLAFLSLPHWIDEIVLRWMPEDNNAVLGLAVLAENGLLEEWSDGSRAVRSVVRRHVLSEMAATTPHEYRRIAGIFADAFSLAADNGGDVFHHIESVFHRLASDASRAENELLADGMAWKSEPLNAFDAIAQLLAAAHEQQERGFLSGRAIGIVGLLQFYVPGPIKSAREEERILGELTKHIGIDALFDAELALRFGLNHIIRGRRKEAQVSLTNALEHFRKLDIPRGEGDALRALGRAALREDNLAEARLYFEKALNIFRTLGLSVSAANCVKSLAETMFYLGQFTVAEHLFEEALAAFVTNSGSLGEANTRVVYSQLLAACARFDAAHNEIALANEVYRALDQRLGIGNCLKNDGVAFFEAERYGEAKQKLIEAAEVYAGWGSRTGGANCSLWTAACLTREKQPELALPLLDSAFSIFRDVGDRFGQASVRREQGIAMIARGDAVGAIVQLDEAQHEFESIGNEVEALATAVSRGFAVRKLGFSSSQVETEISEIANKAFLVFARIGHRRYMRNASDLRQLLNHSATDH